MYHHSLSYHLLEGSTRQQFRSSHRTWVDSPQLQCHYWGNRAYGRCRWRFPYCRTFREGNSRHYEERSSLHLRCHRLPRCHRHRRRRRRRRHHHHRCHRYCFHRSSQTCSHPFWYPPPWLCSWSYSRSYWYLPPWTCNPTCSRSCLCRRPYPDLQADMSQSAGRRIRSRVRRSALDKIHTTHAPCRRNSRCTSMGIPCTSYCRPESVLEEKAVGDLRPCRRRRRVRWQLQR